MSLVTGTDRYTVLYRCFDRDDDLLYVGVTSAGPVRFQQHQGEKGWWPQVSKITVEHFANRDDALEAEAAAIRGEVPKKNVTHATLPPKTVKFSLAWASRRSIPDDIARDLLRLRRRQRTLSKARREIVVRALEAGISIGHIAHMLGTTSLEIERVVWMSETHDETYLYS